MTYTYMSVLPNEKEPRFHIHCNKSLAMTLDVITQS